MTTIRQVLTKTMQQKICLKYKKAEEKFKSMKNVQVSV